MQVSAGVAKIVKCPERIFGIELCVFDERWVRMAVTLPFSFCVSPSICVAALERHPPFFTHVSLCLCLCLCVSLCLSPSPLSLSLSLPLFLCVCVCRERYRRTDAVYIPRLRMMQRASMSLDYPDDDRDRFESGA